MKNLIKILLIFAVVVFLVGCGDDRKRIKTDLLDNEYRKTQEYKDRFDVILYKFWEEMERAKNRNLKK